MTALPNNAALKIHVPVQPPALPDGEVLTLRRAVHRRLDHLALRTQTDGFSRDNYLNNHRALTRFIDAWSVTLPDGRFLLVPVAEPTHRVTPSGRKFRCRKEPLAHGAADAVAAIVQAVALAGLPAGVAATIPAEAVRRNGDRSWAEASNDDLIRWLLANPQWKSGHTKTNNLLAIFDCFHWYAEEHDLKIPYKRKRLPQFVKPARREAENREYIALMGHKTSRAMRRALWALWNVSGFRTCEMREMVWSDFNWEGGFVLTYRHKTARRTNKPRLVGLTDRQLRFFQAIYRQRPIGKPNVFLNCDGEPWNRRSFALHLRRAACRLGLDEGVETKVSGYCLRHSYGTQADEAGVNEQDTAMLMGHAGTQMLRTVYSKASRKVKHVRGAAQRMETARLKARRAAAPQKKQVASETYLDLF